MPDCSPIANSTTPAGEALGLMRQIFQRAQDSDETAAQEPGIDGVFIDGFILLRSGCWG